MTREPVEPGLVPADVLARSDLRRALAEHDFAAAFHLIKKYGGVSQNRIAAACGLTPGKVSNILSGAQRVISYDVVCRIADGLRVPGASVGLSPRPWENEERQEEAGVPADDLRAAPWHPDTAVRFADHLTRSDLVMDRRLATRALAGTLVTGTALLDPLEGWLERPRPATPRSRPGRLGRREVEQLEQTAAAFRRWDHQVGGGLRRKAVVGQLSDVAAALDEHQVPEVETRLHRVMAHLAGTAATMAWDTGLQRRAQDYYQLALRAAHSGRDRPFGANVLAGMARQMLYRGRPQDALELVRLAQEGSGKAATPKVRAMLHTREAWALAAMRRVAGFRRAIAQAQEDLTAASRASEPYWIEYFDEAELAGVTGGRLLELARRDPRSHAEPAAEHIQRALATRGPEAGRSHALDRIGLAECRFLAGDLTEAVTETRRAVEAAERTQSGRVRAQLAELYQYTVGHSASREVRDVRERVRQLLAS